MLFRSVLLCFLVVFSVVMPAAFAAPASVVLSGKTAGVLLSYEGLLVVDLNNAGLNEGERSPGEKAGLLRGDIIMSANGQKMTQTRDLIQILSEGQGKAVKLVVKRDGVEKNIELTPAHSDKDNTYKLGAWIRDSMAGIGTVTFFDPQSQRYGALGHAISDADTGSRIDLAEGSLVPSTVIDVNPGTPGAAGELKGEFAPLSPFAKVEKNTPFGIFGTLESDYLTSGTPVETALPEEINVGPATMLSNVAGDAVESYTIEITKIIGTEGNKNFAIKVTDDKLLQKTGGIVQGMSGSPIVQNGKLVGAVTHVLLDDPTRGYGINITNMLQVAS